MEYTLKVNGKVVTVFMNYQNALAVSWDVLDSGIFGVQINDKAPNYSDLNESKTTFKQFSGA